MKIEGKNIEDIGQLILSIQGLINGLSVDDEVRNNALTMLAESNWESKESIIGTIDYLKSLEGADIEGLDKLSDNIIKLNDAVSDNTTV
jgi:hypothetical protein